MTNIRKIGRHMTYRLNQNRSRAGAYISLFVIYLRKDKDAATACGYAAPAPTGSGESAGGRRPEDDWLRGYFQMSSHERIGVTVAQRVDKYLPWFVLGHSYFWLNLIAIGKNLFIGRTFFLWTVESSTWSPQFILIVTVHSLHEVERVYLTFTFTSPSKVGFVINNSLARVQSKRGFLVNRLLELVPQNTLATYMHKSGFLFFLK